MTLEGDNFVTLLHKMGLSKQMTVASGMSSVIL
jgi:hypothetical protein